MVRDPRMTAGGAPAWWWRAVVPVVDLDRIDRTTEAEIAQHEAEDDAAARQDAATYARRVRRRVGLARW